MRLADMVSGLEFTALGKAPSPVRRLELGFAAETWLKDDAAYGDFGWGGNKIRKLEWLIPDLKRRGVRTVFTVGGTGTHWGLACALYAAKFGMKTVLGLMEQPEDDHVRDQLRRMKDAGAIIYRFSGATRLKLAAAFIILRHGAWFIGPGGSSPLGNFGYVDTALEIAAQVRAGALPKPGTVIVPVGSGGTIAGLSAGLALAELDTRLLGIVVNDSLPLDQRSLGRQAARTAALLRKHGVPAPEPAAFDLRRDWLGARYGDPTPASLAEVERSRAAGIEIEPVYTGKTLAALRDLAPTLAGPVLWINTHGPRG